MTSSQTCNLCFKDQIPCQVIDETQIEVLSLLFVKVRKNILICQNCASCIRSAFDFKGLCLDTEDRLIPLLTQNSQTIFTLREILVKRDQAAEDIHDNLEPCRFCKQFVKRQALSLIDLLLKEPDFRNGVKKYFSEINLAATAYPQICNECHSSLLEFIKFAKVLVRYKIFDTKLVINLNTCMLEDSSRQITTTKNCGLCNNGYVQGDYHEINDDLSHKLGNLFLDLNNENIICNNCRQLVENASDFKSNCFDKRTINSFNVMNGNESSKDYMNTCQFCQKIVKMFNSSPLLSVVENNNLKEITRKHFPELDLDATSDLRICQTCSVSLLDFLNFFMRISAKSVKDAFLVSKVTNGKKNDNKWIFTENRATNGEIVYECQKCSLITSYKSYCYKHARLHDKTENFQCKQCSYTTNNKHQLSVHTKFKHETSQELGLHACTKCHFKSKHRVSLRLHQKLHANKDRVEMYSCKHCKFSTKHKGNLRRHMVDHQPSTMGKLYTCDKCEFQTTVRFDFRKHAEGHENSGEIHIYKCKKCDYQSALKHNYSRHKCNRMDGPLKSYQCDKCKFKTNSKSYLTRHMQRLHYKNVPIFRCEYCSYKTDVRSYLKRHTLIHKRKDEVPTFKCSLCSFTTMHKNNLGRHNLTHEESVALYSCDICGYKTKHKYYLEKSHMLLHQETKLIKCNLCTYETIHKATLGQHKKMAHGNRDELPLYHCDLCDFSTYYKANVNHHKKTHQIKDVVKFKCLLCTFETIYKVSFQAHVRNIHTERIERPFECPQCLFKFKSKHHLKRHLGTVHKKIKVKETDNENKLSL